MGVDTERSGGHRCLEALLRGTARSAECGVAMLALGAMLLGCSLADHATPTRPNVLLVVVDTLRADSLGCYGRSRPTSPAIDALAADAVRFEYAYATAPWTMPSVASILTGHHPSSHGLKKTFRPLSGDSVTLAEIFTEQGYRTAGVISQIGVGGLFGFKQGFEFFSSKHARSHAYVSTEGVTEEAVALLEKFAPASRDAPFFLFVHYFDPHYGYQQHPEYGFSPESVGRLRGGEGIVRLMRLRDRMTRAEIAFLLDLYDGEVRHTDQGIGRLLEALSRLGLRDETLVVVTADHGEEFMEHGWLGHTTLLYDTLLRVPLIMRPPGFDGNSRVVGSAVSLVSLAPTILDVVGVDPAAYDFQGRSFAAHLTADDVRDERIIFAEVDYEQTPSLRSRKRAVIAHPFKLIEDGLSGEVELFDVVSDRGERHDLEAERADVARRLREMLAALGDSAEDPSEPAVELPQEARDMLRGLGYVE